MLIALALSLLASVGLVDVHRHAAWPEDDHNEVRDKQLEEMATSKVTSAVVAVTTPEEVDRWQKPSVIVGVSLACPRNLSEPRYKCFPRTEGWADVAWLEEQISSGKVRALHELGPSYYGISPANPRLEPYWLLAEKFDIPVGIHTQRGPRPGGRFSTRSDPNCCPDFDPEMGNPELLRPVLTRHPNLRIWLQHVGSGSADYGTFWPETLALLRDYPNVYVDLSITNGAMPVEQYEEALKTLIRAGFGDRIMFGSDNLPIQPILARLDSFDWLDEKQKNSMLRENAERFFRIKM
ncbi:amidohydrolase family protein [Qipengyuania sp. RANM35]|uniref:amidohydrolase family protein n=1 Tax=Qipengyuania sp. RANM35 TaxID=3068635 RepID=UPI0034DB5558